MVLPGDSIAPPGILKIQAPPPTCIYMNDFRYAYVSSPDAQKRLGYQTVTPTGSRPFWFKVPISPPFWSISMPRALTNRLNTTDFQFTHYHPQTLNVKRSPSFTCSPFCIYVNCREFFWLQHTLFHTGRSRPPNHKGTTSSFLSGPNLAHFIRVQPWTHRPIYSHNHSATFWTQGMTFNPFLHCPKHKQLRYA